MSAIDVLIDFSSGYTNGKLTTGVDAGQGHFGDDPETADPSTDANRWDITSGTCQRLLSATNVSAGAKFAAGYLAGLGFLPHSDWSITAVFNILRPSTRGHRFFYEIGDSSGYAQTILQSYDNTTTNAHLVFDHNDGSFSNGSSPVTVNETITLGSDMTFVTQLVGGVFTVSIGGVDQGISMARSLTITPDYFHFGFNQGTGTLGSNGPTATVKSIRLQQAAAVVGILGARGLGIKIGV